MIVRVLGCGTSSGVPRIGNDWGACDPNDARNRRTRASILVSHGDVRVLVDTGVDLREQLLAADVADIDAVIWTHDHADHVFGIDDLRQVFHYRGTPPIGYARPETARRLRERFGYVFAGNRGYPAIVELRELPDQLAIGGLEIAVADQPHGAITSAGLRFSADGARVGYATDVNGMTDAMRALYQDLDLWIVDALRRRPHPSHAHLAQVLAWREELQPRQTRLTHLDQSMDFATLCRELPPGCAPAYDGWEWRR